MQPIRKFSWNDGGRSVGGFVGLTGDCVSRAIAIATGLAYRDVYDTLKERYGTSPRNGVPNSIYSPYLRELGWEPFPLPSQPITIDEMLLPEGPTVIQCQRAGRPHAHLCTVIDHVLHDTWDARDDGVYRVTSLWRPGPNARCSHDSTGGVEKKQTGDLTQAEFEKIIQRLKAIDNTARNQASTEAERENALRMMQALMLRHNLSRADLASEEGIESILYTRQACPVSGSRALSWKRSRYLPNLTHLPNDPVVLLTQGTSNSLLLLWPKKRRRECDPTLQRTDDHDRHRRKTHLWGLRARKRRVVRRRLRLLTASRIIDRGSQRIPEWLPKQLTLKPKPTRCSECQNTIGES